jgi:uncharacterized protein (DUF1501 family)
MAGGRISQLVFAGDPVAAHQAYLPLVASPEQIFVMLFLRGGCDGLSLVSPYDDASYVAARRSLALTPSSALTIDPNNAAFNPTSSFGLHPSAAPLRELYNAGKLAIVHACGLNDDTRSHFDAMDYIERGTPGNKSTSTGWLARHLQLVNTGGLLPIVAAGSAAPASLLADDETVVMNDINSYELSGPWRYSGASNPAMLTSLKKFYTGADAFQDAGKRALEVIDAIQSLKAANGGDDLTYTPSPGVTYPSGLGSSLKLLAQIIKLGLGLQAATVDFGGWDTHEEQGTNGGYYADQVDMLARSLHAFYNDLPNHRDRLTVVVMSEFGRRLGANTGGGTDHGHGNVMFVLGGGVNGGKIYGQWPGLVDLDQDQDLKITTDYRSVLGEIVVQRLSNPKLGSVFLGLQPTEYNRLGIIPGESALVDFTAP